jgi:anti-sigma B factor antagonist
MSIHIDKKQNYALIQINSEKLDSLLAPSLKSELVILHGDGVKNMVLDLSQTRYCDSSGLSAILVANRLCKGSNGNLVLMGMKEPVKKIITISKLDSILNITNTLPEAEQML